MDKEKTPESEVIKAVREEYEKKLQEKDEEIKKFNEQHKKEIDDLKKEQIEQIRAVIMGRDTTYKEKKEFEEEPENDFETLIKETKEILKKY